MQDFVTSWLVTESPNINLNTNICVFNNQSKCILSDQDSCQKLLNIADFGLCHNLVDPMPYFMACKDNMCSGESYCNSFEAYSRKCQQMGICLTWRSSEICPYICPSRKYIFFIIQIKYYHLNYCLFFRLSISTL